MGDDYLWTWTERHGRLTVLKLRGELDAVTAGRFAARAVGELRRAHGPVAVDLSSLDFADCAGARALAEVLETVQPWRLAGVSGVKPPVARLFELVGTDLSAPRGLGVVISSLRGQALLTRSDTVRSQSRELMLESSATMARLAATYAGLAAARERRAEQERARAAQMQRLSDTAHDLSVRCRQRALGSLPGGD